MKLIKITKAWIDAYKKEEANELIANSRLWICSGCPHAIQMDGGSLSRFVNITEGKKSDDPVYKCNLCGCPIAKKVYSFSEKCPASPPKW